MADKADQQQEQAPFEAPENDAGQDGFGAAFAERASDPGRQASGPQADGTQPSDKEPAAQAGSEQAPADKAATDQTDSGKASAFDPYSGMTPEQRSYWERREQSERSNRGRIGALTRKLNALATSAPAPSQAPKEEREEEQTSKGTGETGEVSDLDKRLQAVTDEYGDVVGPIAEVLAEVRAEIANLKKGPALQAEVEADAEELSEAYGALEQVHPDYAQIAQDENFSAWLGDQPTKVIELANSFDPREVSLALTLFKTERSAAIASQSGEGGEPGKQEGTATDDKRRRQLEGSRQVRAKSQPAAAGVPKDFSSAFKARAEAHQRR